MSISILATILTAMLVLSSRGEARLVAVVPPPTGDGRKGAAGPPTSEPVRSGPVRTAAFLGAVFIVVLWPNGWGLMAAALAFLGIPRAVVRFEERTEARRDAALARQALPALDLLAACLASGASLADASRAVADALPEPMAERIRAVHVALRLGEEPGEALARLSDVPGLAGVSRALARSARTGAATAEHLLAARKALAEDRTARAMASARSAGVRTVLPLGLCFLPAFVLIGVVPVVASLLPTVFGWT